MKFKIDWKNWKTPFALTFALALVTGVYVDWFWSQDKVEAHHFPSLQQMIPEGYIYQTLDLLNPESLDILIDDFATVRLYKSGASEPFVKGLKVIRAPRDKGQFLAIIPIDSAHLFVKHNHELMAVVETPSKVGTEFVSNRIIKPRSILYGNEER